MVGCVCGELCVCGVCVCVVGVCEVLIVLSTSTNLHHS